MSANRFRIQLQQGRKDLGSKTSGLSPKISYQELVTEIHKLHFQTEKLFPRRNDRERYRKAVEDLVKTLDRARQGQFHVGKAGTKFQEYFEATRLGKTATYRIDVEITGELVSR